MKGDTLPRTRNTMLKKPGGTGCGTFGLNRVWAKILEKGRDEGSREECHMRRKGRAAQKSEAMDRVFYAGEKLPIR